MKILVLGHTGFIGSSIYHYCDGVKGYDLAGVSTDQIDLTSVGSSDLLAQEITQDCVVVFCAGIKKQLGDNLENFSRNIEISKNFSSAVAISPPLRIIFFSSAAVYGDDVRFTKKIDEKTPVCPKTYYGIAKYTAECLLEKICLESQTQLVILRPPLVYGKDDFSLGYGPTGFIYKTINSEDIVVWGDGNEFREFLYVGDVSRVVEQLINNEFSGTLNLASGTSYTYSEIIDTLHEISGKTVRLTRRDRTMEKIDHHYSNKQINSVLENFSFTKLRDGLEKVYNSIIEETKLD